MAEVRRALVIGIDAYEENPLGGCVEDARSVAAVLARHEDGSPNWNVTPLLGETARSPVTGADLRRHLATVIDSDHHTDVLVYFAGHAVDRPWGSEILGSDGTGMSFGDVMRLVDLSRASSITVVLDCCVSGALANNAGTPMMAGGREPAGLFRVERADLREGLTILTASRASEPSAEVGGHGLFTTLLVAGLEGAAADITGRVSALGLYAYCSEAFDANEQRPLLKANVARPVVLRTVDPAVPLPRLRALRQVFASSSTPVRLSMEHEGPGGASRSSDYVAFSGTEPQRELDHLKLWRDARLVATDDGRDFWFACESGGTVRLTPLGRYYWGLVDKGAV